MKLALVWATVLLVGCSNANSITPPNHPFPLDSGLNGAGDGGADGGGGSTMPVVTCAAADRYCGHTFIYTGTGTETNVQIIGTWNDFATPTTLVQSGNMWSATVPVPYNVQVEYIFHVFYNNNTDAYQLDPGAPTIMDGTNTNSLLAAATCDPYVCQSPPAVGPVLTLVAMPVITSSGYSFQVLVTPYNGAELDTSKTIIELNGATLAAGVVPYDASTHTFTVSVTSGLTSPNKYGYVFRVQDTAGLTGTLFVPFWNEATTFEWQDAFLYEIMVDRFFHGGSSLAGPTGAPTTPKGDWMGGDWSGVTQKINAGYFDAMGVNAIWISSPIVNTTLCELGAVGSPNAPYCLSGYHSYFPMATGWVYGSENDPMFMNAGITNPLDPHFGAAADLKALVNAAHAKGIRVLFDLAVNDAFADSSPPMGQSPQVSPIWTAHMTDNNWFNLPYNVHINDCGLADAGQLWDVNGTTWNRTNCWFDAYLPDFNTSSLTANDAIANHAVWLMEEFNLDGFRVDAVKQMANPVCSDLRSKITNAIATGIPFYMVGEALGTNVGNVMDCVGSDKLDGSLDDGLHGNILSTFLQGTENASDFDNAVVYDTNTWTGLYSGAIMGHFFGSHDVARAISYAANDVGDRWASPPPAQETNPTAFKRLALAQAFLLTYDPIPVMWMGDEFGQPGSDDPDNRRMMRFDSALNSYETAELANFQKIGTARLAHSAFRRGTRTRLWVDSTLYAFGRVDGNDIVVAAFNLDPNNSRTQAMSVTNIGLTGTVTDALSNGTATVSGGMLTITLPPLTAAIFTK